MLWFDREENNLSAEERAWIRWSHQPENWKRSNDLGKSGHWLWLQLPLNQRKDLIQKEQDKIDKVVRIKAEDFLSGLPKEITFCMENFIFPKGSPSEK